MSKKLNVWNCLGQWSHGMFRELLEGYSRARLHREQHRRGETHSSGGVHEPRRFAGQCRRDFKSLMEGLREGVHVCLG